MKWGYRIWCPDCTGEDSQGCFDGETVFCEEIVGTREAAVDAGLKFISDGIWRVMIHEVNAAGELLEPWDGWCRPEDL